MNLSSHSSCNIVKPRSGECVTIISETSLKVRCKGRDANEQDQQAGVWQNLLFTGPPRAPFLVQTVVPSSSRDWSEYDLSVPKAGGDLSRVEAQPGCSSLAVDGCHHPSQRYPQPGTMSPLRFYSLGNVLVCLRALPTVSLPVRFMLGLWRISPYELDL